MKESTALLEQEGILVDQQTVTGGVRTYGTHVRRLEDGEILEGGICRFEIEIPYSEPQYVKGVLTCTVAEWLVEDPRASFRIGCYMHKLSFDVNRAIVDILVKTENARVVAVNIEGRIVDTRNLTL